MTPFDASGYINYDWVKSVSSDFTHIITGRGTGKTYMIKRMVADYGRLLFVRRTATQMEAACDMALTPFFEIFGESIFIKKYKNFGGVWESKEDFESGAKPFITIVAMSTFQNMAGVDLREIRCVVFDEYIPQKGERPMKHEFQAYKNIMEIVYRNNFSKKVNTFFFGNSNAISSNILIGCRLITPLYQLVMSNKSYVKIPDKNTTLIYLRKTPISEKKSRNAFYSSIGADRAGMELAADFADLDLSNIKHCNLAEYVHDTRTPVFSIWRHKSNNTYYVTDVSRAEPISEYPQTTNGLELWQKDCHSYLYRKYLSNDMLFASFELQQLFVYSLDCTKWSDICL